MRQIHDPRPLGPWLSLGLPLASIVTLAAGPVDGAPEWAPDRATPGGASVSADDDEPALELGAVDWLRDVDAALARAGELGRPVFAMFQEVPGCATCRGFGAGPLSEPLLVEAIEELFVPLAIHNNKGGADAEALERFDEPSWNNPVVRLLDGAGADLIEREDGLYDTASIAARMVAALEAADTDAPAWLDCLALEREDLARATFRTSCFWQGEAHLGGIEGVATTRAGWLNGREVVTVRFDSDVLPLTDLIERAEDLRCVALSEAGTPRDARDSDQHYFLRRTPLAQLDLQTVQRTKLNALVYERRAPGEWLSPRQHAHLAELEQAGR